MIRKLFHAVLIFAVLFLLGATGAVVVGDWVYYKTPITKWVAIDAGSLELGPAAPDTCTSGIVTGPCFQNHTAFVNFGRVIPTCRVDNTDIYIMIFWTNQNGDALDAGETVVWQYAYRVLTVGGDVNTGDLTTVTEPYTQSGAGTDGEFFSDMITLPYNDGDNPLVTGEAFAGNLTFAAASTYAGKPILGGVFLGFTVDELCEKDFL